MKVTVTKGSAQDQSTMSVNVYPVGYNASLADGDVLLNGSATEGPPGQVVALRDLSVTEERSQTAAVRWSTTAPLPPSEFIIQHRPNSSAGWSTLGTVDAAETVRHDAAVGPAYRFDTNELEGGRHQFRLAYVPPKGNNEAQWTSEVMTAKIELEEAYQVTTYPNPVSDRATVELAVQESQHVTVGVYDVLGRRVATLHEGPLSGQERHHLSLETGRLGLTSGTYFLRVTGQDFVATRQLTLMR